MADRWKEIQLLLTALAPFANAADDLSDKARDDDNIWESPAAMSLNAGQLRAAAKAFKAFEPEITGRASDPYWDVRNSY